MRREQISDFWQDQIAACRHGRRFTPRCSETLWRLAMPRAVPHSDCVRARPNRDVLTAPSRGNAQRTHRIREMKSRPR